MFLRRKSDKITNEVLYKENKKLIKENEKLREHINTIQDLKMEYESLILDVKSCKKRYEDKLKEIDKIEIDYKRELDAIIKNAK